MDSAENQINGNAHDAAAAADNAQEIVSKSPLKTGAAGGGGGGDSDGTQANGQPAGTGSSDATKTNGETDAAVPAAPADPEPEPEPVEITKRSIRVQTWKKIEGKEISVSPYLVFNKIPNFIGAEKAAQLFAETSEFINAHNIRVDVERTLDAVKIHVLSAGKDLFISRVKRINSLFSKVICGPDEPIELKQKVIMPQHLDEHGMDISFTEKIELDLLVIGSVAVSKLGQRIGRGNGYIDLDFGILKHCGSVTDKTIIVTIVHDEQIYDTLQADLFTNYDIPVDIIITPTQVIRVEKRLTRPTGIHWNLLSERRLGVVPVLKLIKENEEQAGKIIVLKEEDTDVERYIHRRRFYQRFFNRPRKQRNDTENDNNDSKPQRSRKPLYRRNKKHSKPVDDSEQSSSENKKSPSKTKNTSEKESNEVTKRSLRFKTWKEFSENRCAALPYLIYNRIPNFIGAEKAANLLGDIDEFKQAKTIKVCSDKAQDPVKIKVINDLKELFVAAARDSTALYTKINCPNDAEAEIKQMAIRSQHLSEYGHDIEFKDKVELDMLVIGSVAVSKLGQRIGRGQGFVDLDFGILVKAGAITDKTTIVTTVHDQQVSDTLPDELFAEYDVPVDIIVTPTEVIRVENKRKRPEGIYWNLLTKRRVSMIPVLKALKDKDESDGVTVELKEEDENEARRPGPRRYGQFRRNHRTFSETNSKNNGDGTAMPRRKFIRQYRKPKQSVTDVTDGEQSSSEKRIRPKKKRISSDYCIKVSRIPKNARPRTLKAELREHGCSPLSMIWKGYQQTCYLYFSKQLTGRGGVSGGATDDTDYEEEVLTTVSTALQNLSINDTNDTQTNPRRSVRKIRVEFVKRNQNSVNAAAEAPTTQSTDVVNGTSSKSTENRIETVEVSAV